MASSSRVVEVGERRPRAARAARARRRAAAAGTPRWASRRCARAAPRAARAAAAPYLTITQCQPAASNIAASRPAAMSGTTRSSDWRLRSTTHMTSPSARHHRVGDRLPAGALVELGVADQRDLAPADAARRSARRRSGARARPRSARSRRGRPSRSSSRPGRGPSCGTGRTAGRRTGAASSGSARSSRPSRWLIACSTGDACGLTLTRGRAPRGTRTTARSSATPSTRSTPGGRRPSRPSGSARTRLAWWTIAVASHSTRRWTRSSTSRSSARGCSAIATSGRRAPRAEPATPPHRTPRSPSSGRHRSCSGARGSWLPAPRARAAARRARSGSAATIAFSSNSSSDTSCSPCSYISARLVPVVGEVVLRLRALPDRAPLERLLVGLGPREQRLEDDLAALAAGAGARDRPRAPRASTRGRAASTARRPSGRRPRPPAGPNAETQIGGRRSASVCSLQSRARKKRPSSRDRLALPQAVDEASASSIRAIWSRRRRPVVTDRDLVERLAGADAEERPAGEQALERHPRLRDQRRVIARARAAVTPVPIGTRRWPARPRRATPTCGRTRPAPTTAAGDRRRRCRQSPPARRRRRGAAELRAGTPRARRRRNIASCRWGYPAARPLAVPVRVRTRACASTFGVPPA